MATRISQESVKEEVAAFKRERILREAAKLFFERGYVQTSMDAIADSLGATKQYVYYHFSSKSDLIVEICERQVRDAVAATDRAMATEGSALSRLQLFIRDFTTSVLRDYQFVAIYFREQINLPPAASERIANMRRRLDRRLRTILAEGMNSGEFEIRDVNAMALLIAGMSSYAFAWYREGGRLDPQQVAELISEASTKMVIAPGKENKG